MRRSVYERLHRWWWDAFMRYEEIADAPLVRYVVRRGWIELPRACAGRHKLLVGDTADHQAGT